MSELTHMTREEVLPVSNKTVVLRGMTGHEEDMFTDKKLMKQGKAIDKILQACVLTIDGEAPSEADIRNLCTPDRTYLVVTIRKESYGDIVEDAEVKCSDKDCNNKMVFDIDLTTLPMKQLPEGQDDTTEFEFELPVTKTKGKYRFLTGNDEGKLSKLGQEEILTIGMMLRLTEVENVHPNGYKKWLKGLPVRDRSYMRKHMENTDAGLNTEVTFTCDECGNDIKTRVESLKSFFFPEM